MADSPAPETVQILERVGLIPHPNDDAHPPIEPYVSDILPDLLAKYEWLGLILAVFDSASGLGENPPPPSIHVFYDQASGRTGLPMCPDAITSHADAERWLDSLWQNPRQDFNVSTLAPQLVLQVGDRHYLAVTLQLEKALLGRMKHNEHWSADLSAMDESSLEFEIVKTIATDYMDMT